MNVEIKTRRSWALVLFGLIFFSASKKDLVVGYFENMVLSSAATSRFEL